MRCPSCRPKSAQFGRRGTRVGSRSNERAETPCRLLPSILLALSLRRRPELSCALSSGTACELADDRHTGRLALSISHERGRRLSVLGYGQAKGRRRRDMVPLASLFFQLGRSRSTGPSLQPATITPLTPQTNPSAPPTPRASPILAPSISPPSPPRRNVKRQSHETIDRSPNLDSLTNRHPFLNPLDPSAPFSLRCILSSVGVDRYWRVRVSTTSSCC